VPSLRPRRRIGALVSATLVALTLLPVIAAPVGAAGGSGFVNMTNGHRNDHGLGPVGLHATIDAIAVERGHQIAEAEQIGHDFDYLRRRFDEEGICWRGFGEIVAVNGSGDFSAFGTQWMNSPTHRDVMLGDYTHAGGSREEAGGRWYGVMVFVKLCNASTPPPTSSGFVDLGNSTFIDDIEWLVEQGITSGCAPNRFCPRDPVERGQMASFLQRAFDFPGTSNDFFTDDAGSTHEIAINRTRQAQVASGCAASRFCPRNAVTRGQMASFLARALDLPPASGDYFGDDNGSTHEDAINRLAQAGIASGCTSSRFCPDRPVTREQMAGFLQRALD
jgi:S-layer homology domain/Cysteine-rich secretory protein family